MHDPFLEQKLDIKYLNALDSINEFKAKWNIPINGFGNAKDYFKWYCKHLGKALLKPLNYQDFLIFWPDLDERIDASKIDDIGIRSYQKEFVREITVIFLRHGIQKMYHEFILRKILNDTISMDDLKKVDINIPFEGGDKPIADRLILEIYPDTTIKDVQKFWPQVIAYQKLLTGYNKKRKGARNRASANFERDKTMYNYFKSWGWSLGKIADFMNSDEKYKKKSKKKLNDYYTEKDVSKIIVRFINKYLNG